MRESSPQREIVVPGDMRPRSGRRATGRMSATSPSRSGGAMADVAAGLRWFGGVCLRRPGEVTGVALTLGAAAIISVNALGYQSGRHPAPILPQPRATAAAAAPVAPPLPAKPVEQLVEHAAASTKPEVQTGPRDAIGALIRSDDVTASVTPKPEKAVMQAQRALTRLGYGPLKDDGVMGPGTKAAIEKFERARKLPVKGEASGRTLRELAARAAQAKG